MQFCDVVPPQPSETVPEIMLRLDQMFEYEKVEYKKFKKLMLEGRYRKPKSREPNTIRLKI